MNSKKRALLLCLVATAVLAGSSGVAWAQRPAHYYPARSPISPYLGYSAINSTGVPNYYTYIRPSMQFQALLDERASLDARQTSARIAFDEERLGEILTRQLEMRRTTGIGAPAASATFQDYSHFYRANPASRGPGGAGLRSYR